jgi:cytochrome c
MTIFVAAFAVALTTVYVLSAAPGASGRQAPGVAGSPAAGRAAIGHYACGACHSIAGVRQADGQVGPPLTGVAGRRYLGGRLVNTPENMSRWIQNPQAFAPGTAMPNLGVSESDARDITAYLYTLR